MAEQDYNKRIAEAKTALERYSDQTGELKKLYDKAIENLNASYEAQNEKLEKQVFRDKNKASVEAKLAEKNLDQQLAARGLAFSGENAQTALDMALLLQNRYADIDADAAEKQAENEAKKNDALLSLEKEKLSETANGYEKQASLEATLAGLEQSKAAYEAEQKAKQGGEITEETPEPDPEDPFAAAKAFGEKVKASAKKATEKQYVTPAVAASTLAKQLIGTVSSSGHIYTSKQQTALEKLLAEMQAKETFEPAYYQQLLLNLQSMGYSSGNAAKKVDEKALEKGAAEAYFEAYQRFDKIYKLAGHSTEEADAMALEKAREQQLQYLYDNTYGNDQFVAVVSMLGLSEYLDAFYEKLYNK